MDNELDTMLEEAVTPEAEEVEEKPEQTREERARQAEGRRQRERKAYSAGYQASRAEFNEVLNRLGIENPETGKAIGSVDELIEYEKKLSDKRMESGNGTAADIRRIVDEQINARTAQPAIDEGLIRDQLAQINALDPTIKELGDILNSDVADKFRDYVDKGLDFVESYKLAASDKLQKINANRSAVRSGGKDHLSATTQRGEGSLSVPSDELAIFRELMPDATDADIQKYYNADRKRFG